MEMTYDTNIDEFICSWKESCIEMVKELRPDLIIADIFSCGIGADKLGIPYIINAALPLASFNEFGFVRALEMKRANNCCGCICVF